MQLSTGASTPDDILDTLEPATLPVHEFPWETVLIVAAIAVLVALAVYIWKRRHPPIIVESLEQIARRRLKQLDTTDPRVLHTELASILTEYAEHRLGLRGTRLTSAEILRAFRDNGVMNATWRQSLADFLRACDQAKFAPTVEPCDAAARAAQCRSLFDALAAAFASTSTLATPWHWSTPDLPCGAGALARRAGTHAGAWAATSDTPSGVEQ
jgi:hypothetical protein